MTTEPISRLIPALAIPTIISMLVTALYNMADTYFVGKINTSATGAVGIVFSLMTIIQVIGMSLGVGSGSYVARLLGAKNSERATLVVTTAFFTALVLGLILTVMGELFLSPLMKALGSTETILPYAKSYARYILLEAPYMAASFVMNVNLRSEGSAVLGMIGLVSGAVLNIGLDPLFMFVFGMGIAGAAVAGMSVVTRIIMFINSIMLGFGQGFQPVAAFNYAAGKKDRVYEAFWFSVRVGAVFLSFFALIAGAFAPWIIRVFRDDPQVVQVGAFALRMQSIALPLSAYIVISNMMFQYIGKPEKATVLAVSRQGLVFVPLILILSHLFGLPGIQVSQALADLTTFLIAVILTRGTLGSLKEG